MGMILRIASSRIVGQGDIVGRSGYFSLNLSANSVMRGRLDARRTLKSLVADLRFILNFRMKRFRFCLVAGMLLFISVSTVAKGVPTSIQAAFEKMYPYVANAQWEQMAGCYVAEFVIDGRETDVWFDENAQWVMMENDVESLEKVPAPVAEAFMESIMASMRLRDVRIVTFPKRPAVIVIEVEGYNSGEEFQLFYAPDGKLQRQLNVSELGGEIYPGLFN